ncbi:hypothetical protein KR215_002148 [Drosophila sulfurigaster]|nr:hypothetical protein KR215_002148 [Drosophila sulfurigaster]
MRRWNLDIFFCLAVVLMFNSQAFGYQTLQYRGHAKHPILPNHCYYEELELDVPMNETVYPVNQHGYCVHVSCEEDYLLLIKHCEHQNLQSGCFFAPYDYTKPYPDCCEKHICPT